MNITSVENHVKVFGINGTAEGNSNQLLYATSFVFTSQDTYEFGNFFEASFQLSAGTLTNTIVHNGYSGVDSLVMDDVRIFGEQAVVSVIINGGIHDAWTQDSGTGEIVISDAGIPVNSVFTIVWS